MRRAAEIASSFLACYIIGVLLWMTIAIVVSVVAGESFLVVLFVGALVPTGALAAWTARRE